MDAKRFAIGTVVAAVSLSIAGVFIFGVLLPDFYTQFMNAGSATGVPRLPMLWWSIAIGMVSYGAVITLVIVSRPQPVGTMEGMATGAAVSFLMWLTADCILYGISNVGNVMGILVDPLLEAVPGALAGALVATFTGKAATAREPVRKAA